MALRRLTRTGLAAAIAVALASWAAPAARGGDAAAKVTRSPAVSDAAPRALRLEDYRRWTILRFGSPPSTGPLSPDNDGLDELWRSLALRYGADGRPHLPARRPEIRV